jgi:hypothetical protein
VQFTNSTNGYALGNNGTLLKYGPLGGGGTVAPTVTTTSPATGITANSATVAGNVTSDGGDTVTARGFVYGAGANPAIGGAGVTNVAAGSGTGAFSMTLTGLTAISIYHVRAYAINSAGTAYGADVTFTTLAAATVPIVTTTSPATGITATGATVAGNAASDGGSTITERGFVYGTSINPAIGGVGVTKVTVGSGTGTFSTTLNGLAASTVYHVKAYAANGEGTSYGADITFTTLSTGGGGGSAGGGTTGTMTYTADVLNNNIKTVTLPVTVAEGSTVGIINLTGEKAVELFTAKDAVIRVPAIPDVDSYCLELPAQTLAAGKASDALTLDTPFGSVTLPGNMLGNLTGTDGKKAGITIGWSDASSLTDAEKAAVGTRPLIQLTLTLDGKQIEWNNPIAPVTVIIPYTPTAEELKNPESIIIWYLDGSGKPVCIPNGHYNPVTGMVTFTTTHFSRFAVGYREVRFADVQLDAWYCKAVSFAAARGITNGTGDERFSPNANLTRGEFLVLLMRAYDIKPDMTPGDNFTDAGDTWYTGYLAAAKRLGIAAGIGGNLFAPEQTITRQEMLALLYNALKAINKLPKCNSNRTLSEFNDEQALASWARESVTYLVGAGIISGSNGLLSPADTTTRAEVAQVLYNLLTA